MYLSNLFLKKIETASNVTLLLKWRHEITSGITPHTTFDYTRNVAVKGLTTLSTIYHLYVCFLSLSSRKFSYDIHVNMEADKKNEIMLAF
jgi:hypothetical protein